MSNEISSQTKFHVLTSFRENMDKLFSEFNRAGDECEVAATKCYSYICNVMYENELSEFSAEMKLLKEQMCAFVKGEVTKASIAEPFADVIVKVDAWLLNEKAKRDAMRNLITPIFDKAFDQLMEDVLDVVVVSE